MSDASVEIEPGDIINVPTLIYRGFRCVSDDPDALLLTIVGGPDAGNVAWHPSVVDAARGTGLEVGEDGNLRKIDS